jgi:hypothetical protein
MGLAPVSMVTFDELNVRLVVSRGAHCALLIHLGARETIGAFMRLTTGKLEWLARAERTTDNPTEEVWRTVASMI